MSFLCYFIFQHIKLYNSHWRIFFKITLHNNSFIIWNCWLFLWVTLSFCFASTISILIRIFIFLSDCFHHWKSQLLWRISYFLIEIISPNVFYLQRFLIVYDICHRTMSSIQICPFWLCARIFFIARFVFFRCCQLTSYQNRQIVFNEVWPNTRYL